MAQSSTPLADALAEVDRAQNRPGGPVAPCYPAELAALRALAEAVRAHLIAPDPRYAVRGHYHAATGHEDTLCQCPEPGRYAPGPDYDPDIYEWTDREKYDWQGLPRPGATEPDHEEGEAS